MMRNEWKPIETAPVGVWVFVKCEGCMPDIAIFHKMKWKNAGNFLDWENYNYDDWPITHWMPLPNPPEQPK